jgi:hypothetical protein
VVVNERASNTDDASQIPAEISKMGPPKEYRLEVLNVAGDIHDAQKYWRRKHVEGMPGEI